MRAGRISGGSRGLKAGAAWRSVCRPAMSAQRERARRSRVSDTRRQVMCVNKAI